MHGKKLDAYGPNGIRSNDELNVDRDMSRNNDAWKIQIIRTIIVWKLTTTLRQSILF